MIYQPVNENHPQEKEFYENYFIIPAETCKSYFYNAVPENETDVYIITFNNLFLAEYQIKTLRRFLKSPFNLIVVDNNNWLYPEESESLFQLCVRERVVYLKAPDNFHQREISFDPTMKLGTTMNWLYLNCVRKRQPRYFGYLDQDCFLIHEFDIRSWLGEKGMYGRVVRSAKTEAWTLHVTVNFYRFDFVRNFVLDFRAQHNLYLDTGSANYPIIYKNLNPNDYEITQKTFRFSEQDVNRKNSVQHYEIIDGVWYHMGASSHDQLAGDGEYKLAYTKGYLDAILND